LDCEAEMEVEESEKSSTREAWGERGGSMPVGQRRGDFGARALDCV
jgi:hypothetical protein